MNEHLISDLSRFVDGRSVTMSETPGHVRLDIARGDVSLSVLVPRNVLEWWVEATATSSGNRVEDWCDYAGYGAAAEQELSEDMRADVVSFIENVLARPLRLTESGRGLEWHIGGAWRQAVPLVSDAEQGAAGDMRTHAPERQR